MKSYERTPAALWGMTLILIVSAYLAAGVSAPDQHKSVNQKSAVIGEFERRVAGYIKLRKAAVAPVPGLKSTASPAKILERQHMMADKIRAMRPGATQGNIFTPAIASEFRRLLQNAVHGPRGSRIHASLERGEPVKISVEVNHPYPAEVPIQNTPPSLLLKLPKLPSELEYRVVGHDLVLYDVKANLVVDFVPRAMR